MRRRLEPDNGVAETEQQCLFLPQLKELEDVCDYVASCTRAG